MLGRKDSSGRFTITDYDPTREPASGESVYIRADVAPGAGEPPPSNISPAGLKFLTYLEGGTRLHPYDDLTGRDWDGQHELVGHLAIGVGRTLFDSMYTPDQMERWVADGIEVHTALAWLQEDVEPAVRAVVDLQHEMSIPLVQHQFDALVCFAFNIGTAGFRKSSLWRRLTRTSEHMPTVVREELPRWKYSRGQVVQGLLNRRRETIELFCEADYTPQWFMPRG